METIILSLGGSILVPDEIDYFFLKEFKQFVLDYIEKDYKFIIFCGGGRINTKYITAAKRISKIKEKDLDWVGIMASRLNAELLRVIFQDLSAKKVIYDPTEKITLEKPVTVAAGWKPGWSTDYDAVLMAEQLNINEVINLTNISYVYDKDPNKHKDAEKIKETTWKKYLEIIGEKWSPRLSTPFDPIASKKAKQIGLKVAIIKGTDLKNLRNYLEKKDFKGTLISNSSHNPLN
ncbi:UMP kinase [Candidatus Woesearchaeota archaeon]|nr:UMP kinase [Candidatus Woesearchaeota archaeon]